MTIMTNGKSSDLLILVQPENALVSFRVTDKADTKSEKAYYKAVKDVITHLNRHSKLSSGYLEAAKCIVMVACNDADFDTLAASVSDKQKAAQSVKTISKWAHGQKGRPGKRSGQYLLWKARRAHRSARGDVIMRCLSSLERDASVVSAPLGLVVSRVHEAITESASVSSGSVCLSNKSACAFAGGKAGSSTTGREGSAGHTGSDTGRERGKRNLVNRAAEGQQPSSEKSPVATENDKEKRKSERMTEQPTILPIVVDPKESLEAKQLPERSRADERCKEGENRPSVSPTISTQSAVTEVRGLDTNREGLVGGQPVKGQSESTDAGGKTGLSSEGSGSIVSADESCPSSPTTDGNFAESPSNEQESHGTEENDEMKTLRRLLAAANARLAAEVELRLAATTKLEEETKRRIAAEERLAVFVPEAQGNKAKEEDPSAESSPQADAEQEEDHLEDSSEDEDGDEQVEESAESSSESGSDSCVSEGPPPLVDGSEERPHLKSDDDDDDDDDEEEEEISSIVLQKRRVAARQYTTEIKNKLQRAGVGFLMHAAKMEDDIIVKGKIGKGAMAQVRGIVYKDSKKQEAVMKFTKGSGIVVKKVGKGANKFAANQSLNEIQILHRIKNRHSNIVPVYSTDIENAAMVMLKAHCDLQSALSSSGGEASRVERLSHAQRIRLWTGILSGLSYLHEEINVVHGDVKPPNVLVNAELTHVWLADFGMSGEAGVDDVNGGTYQYLSPDATCVLANALGCPASKSAQDFPLSPSIDIYAAGLIGLQLFTATKASVVDEECEGVDLRDLTSAKMNPQGFFKESTWPQQRELRYPQKVKTVFLSMVQPDPRKRIGLRKVKELSEYEEMWVHSTDNVKPVKPGKTKRVHDILSEASSLISRGEDGKEWWKAIEGTPWWIRPTT